MARGDGETAAEVIDDSDMIRRGLLFMGAMAIMISAWWLVIHKTVMAMTL